MTGGEAGGGAGALRLSPLFLVVLRPFPSWVGLTKRVDLESPIPGAGGREGGREEGLGGKPGNGL